MIHRGRKSLKNFNSLNNKYVHLVFRLFLGIIFIWASVDKILSPADFAKIVYNYRILPDFMINMFGIILPWLEFFCGIFLVVGFRTQSSALILSILLIVFMIALSAAIVRDLNINCGCFSTDPEPGSRLGYSLLLRDLFMLVMSVYLVLFSSNFLTLSAITKKRLDSAR